MSGNAPDLDVDGRGRCVALIVARFNQEVTDELAAGAREALLAAGVAEENVLRFDVPGAFELAPTCRQVLAAAPDDYDALVVLGAVVRGETPHFDFLAEAVADALQQLANEINIPLVFGVLTTDTLDQAVARADRSRGAKGGEAARAALSQVALFERLRERRTAPVRGFRIP